MTPHEYLCSTCFEGRARRTIGPGRTVPDIAHGVLEVPADFPLYVCDNCGEMIMGYDDAVKLAAWKATQ